jgi:hypothetical protein
LLQRGRKQAQPNETWLQCAVRVTGEVAAAEHSVRTAEVQLTRAKVPGSDFTVRVERGDLAAGRRAWRRAKRRSAAAAAWRLAVVQVRARGPSGRVGMLNGREKKMHGRRRGGIRVGKEAVQRSRSADLGRHPGRAHVLARMAMEEKGRRSLRSRMNERSGGGRGGGGALHGRTRAVPRAWRSTFGLALAQRTQQAAGSRGPGRAVRPGAGFTMEE